MGLRGICTNHHGATVAQRPARQLDRRTLVKATAGFVGMATAFRAASPVSAQDAVTRAGEWVQPDAVGGEADYLAFEADFAFNAVAAHWPGNTPFPAAVEITVSDDGETWSDPVVVGPAHTDAGPIDRDGRIFAELLFTQDASIVRYRGLDADGNVIAIPGLSFTYIDAKAGPSITDYPVNDAAPNASRPPIIGRQDWGAGLAYGGVDHGEVEWTTEYEPVRHVIIHHSETPQFRDPMVEIRSIHYYHAVTRGWGDIGYNYLVDYMGNVYEGRAGGENVVGGHAFQYARGSAGICTMGSFTSASATPETIAGLTWITAWSARNLDPLARSDFHQTPNLPTICGHRDVVNSSCPGDGLYADLPTIRQAVADVLNGARAILTDPAYSPGQAVTITVDDANLRTRPGTDKDIAGTVPLGALMHVSDGPTTTEGYTWYQLTGDSGSGWMASDLFTRAEDAPASGAFAPGDRVQVDTNMLNLRSEPSLRAAANVTVPYATAADVIEGPNPTGGYRWYYLETSSGGGWAVENYLTREGDLKPQTRFAVGDTVAVNDPEGLRLRSGAGAGNAVLLTLPNGTRGTIVGAARVVDADTWIEIQTSLGTGWVVESYLEPSIDPPDTPARFERGDEVVISSDSVRLREAPGTDRAIITTLGNGISGLVTEPPSAADNMYWARIETSYGTGWVAEAFLSPANGESDEPNPTFADGDRVFIDTDGINLREAPSTAGERVTILYRNDTGTVLDGPTEADGYVWYQLETSQGTGWGVARYLSLDESDPAGIAAYGIGDAVEVTTDRLHLRKTPGTDQVSVVVITTGVTGIVLDGPRSADGYTWYQIETDAGTGWGVSDYLGLTSNAATSGTRARVIDGELNLRDTPDASGAVLAVLPDGAIVDVLDESETGDGHEWVKVFSSTYGSGWCVSDYLERL